MQAARRPRATAAARPDGAIRTTHVDLVSATDLLFWLGFFHAAFPVYGALAGFSWLLTASLFRQEVSNPWLRRPMAGCCLVVGSTLLVASVVLTDQAVNDLFSSYGGALPDYSARRTALSPSTLGPLLHPKEYRSGRWMVSLVGAAHVFLPFLVGGLTILFTRRPRDGWRGYRAAVRGGLKTSSKLPVTNRCLKTK